MVKQRSARHDRTKRDIGDRMSDKRHKQDDAAAAFAWMLPYLHEGAKKYEYASGIVPTEDGYTYSTPKTSKQTSEFNVSLPATMQALIHNHPAEQARSGREYQSARDSQSADENFSQEDRSMAKALKMPSYIVTPSDRLMRYDPATKQQEEVLAQFPWDEYKAYLMQKMGREADDTRGLLKYVQGGPWQY